MLLAQKFESFSPDLLDFIEFHFRELVVFWHKRELGIVFHSKADGQIFTSIPCGVLGMSTIERTNSYQLTVHSNKI